MSTEFKPFFSDAAAAAAASRDAFHGLPDAWKTGLRPAVFERPDGAFDIGTWPSARADEMPEGAWMVHR